ncbi:protein FAM177A1 [Patella vulgata]|uniref:protein FAM177A1 n=1 Tax=Patella vulgata TaxID=6465 RepID=UPI00217FCA20|nr:protein FAM177A1 [Patella vulgata]
MATEEVKPEQVLLNTVARPEFTNISLEGDLKPVKKKVPRRIIHFSDGTLEEYSTDEDEEKPPPKPTVDPKTLTWLPWFWHYFVVSAASALGVADFCGEKLAWFFGITSPKYQHAIDEYYRLKEEDEAEKRRTEKYEGSTPDLSSINVEKSGDSKTPTMPPSPSKIGVNKQEYQKY